MTQTVRRQRREVITMEPKTIMASAKAAITDCMYGAMADLQHGNDLLTGDRFERMRLHFRAYEQAYAASRDSGHVTGRIEREILARYRGFDE